MALSTSSAASARGQMEKEASPNVRGWIREADYASEVRARRKCNRREGNGGRAGIDLSECWHEWILTKLVCMYGFMQLRPEVCVCVCFCVLVCVCERERESLLGISTPKLIHYAYVCIYVCVGLCIQRSALLQMDFSVITRCFCARTIRPQLNQPKS